MTEVRPIIYNDPLMPQERQTIGIIDQDPRRIRHVMIVLGENGYEPFPLTGKLQYTLDEIFSRKPAAIIIACGGDDMGTLSGIRKENPQLPILAMVSWKDSIRMAQVLDGGADDCFVFGEGTDNQREFVARVGAVIRRVSRSEKIPVFHNDELTIDHSQHLVTLSDQEVGLTRTEYGILFQLAQNVGRTVLQNDILSTVWGREYLGEAHLLRVNIARLRGKLGEDSEHPRFVVTKKEVGYGMPDYNQA